MYHSLLNKTTEIEIPCIYVADLADYTAGILRGEWIEITKDTTKEMLLEVIFKMLKEKGHEEYAIHDYDNIPDCLGEYPDLQDVIAVAHAVIEHGFKLVSAFLSVFEVDELDSFSDRFRGVYNSVEEYAREFIDDCYELEKMIGELACYFDYKSFARDMELNGDICSVAIENFQVAIFVRD